MSDNYLLRLQYEVVFVLKNFKASVIDVSYITPYKFCPFCPQNLFTQ